MICINSNDFKLRRSIYCPKEFLVSKIRKLTFSNCALECRDNKKCVSFSFNNLDDCLLREKPCYVKKFDYKSFGVITLDKHGILTESILHKFTWQSSTEGNYVSGLANDGKADKTNFLLNSQCSMTKIENVSLFPFSYH